MRTAAGFILTLSLATGLFAQVRGSQPAVAGTGNAVYPAGGPGTPGVTRFPVSVVHPAGGQYYRGTGGRAVFAYPVYIGGYYSVPYITQQDPSAYAPVQPNVTVVNQPQAAPPVIINNYYSSAPPSPDATQPMPQSAADSAAPVTEPAHYLIAFQDHTIYAATAYWVDGDTLHYFTSGNVHNQVSLALVDRPLTERLNKEAGVDLKLPAPSK
jgi:hypothetical protein